jgi:hypothetical protein
MLLVALNKQRKGVQLQAQQQQEEAVLLLRRGWTQRGSADVAAAAAGTVLLEVSPETPPKQLLQSQCSHLTPTHPLHLPHPLWLTTLSPPLLLLLLVPAAPAAAAH